MAASDGTAGPRRIWRRIFWTTGAAVVLLVAAVAFRLQQRLRLDRQITIGPETTVVEGPLAADGLIDYVAAVNELQSKGVTQENNAVVLLIEAFGPAAIPAEDRACYCEQLGIGPPPVSGTYMVEPSVFFASRHDRTASEIIDERHPFLQLLVELGSRPWSRVEYPDAAALLDANALPLERVVEASTRARWYSPLVGSGTLDYSWTPLVAECCIAVRLLTVRSMLRLEEGEVDDAWDDLLAAHRLTRLMGQCREIFAALEMDAAVCRGDAALAQSNRLTAGQAARCLTEFESLRPVARIADHINRHERLVVIDEVHQAVRGQIDLFSELDTLRWLVNAGVDWNAVLRIVNCVIDDFVADLRIQSYPERTRRLCNLVDEHERRFTASKTDADARVAAITGMNYEISTYLGHWHARIINTLADVSFVQARDEARRRMVRLAFALAAYRADRGVYPEELETLIPEHIDEVPLDPFTAAPLRFERTDPDDYRLYSVGENLTDDGGRGHESDPPGDDIAIGILSTNRPGEPGTHAE